ncbi:MAG: lytic transglycosylase domain-containing protein [Methylobacteriaceae bacterium]|nr:lytic transglycosylase domain-containing protein [Methylobacteriaceae bacterium]
MRATIFAVLLTLLAMPAGIGQVLPNNGPTDLPEASGATEDKAGTVPDPRESMCLLIEAAARANDLPLDFFARVIWQESRFQADRVGPPTSGGERAQGIAQFLPSTAAQRQLLDPFDPVQALPKSAELLRDLRIEFGNWGLAAAAYNAGPQRVREWKAGKAALAGETRNYVLAVTGAPIEDWANGDQGQPSGLDCRQLIALLERAPNPFVEKLEEKLKVIAASPWGVQLSAGFSRARALATYASVAKRYGEALAGHDPSVLSTTLRSRGTRTFYQIRAGAETRAEADTLCASIRRAGGACMVVRNRVS